MLGGNYSSNLSGSTIEISLLPASISQNTVLASKQVRNEKITPEPTSQILMVDVINNYASMPNRLGSKTRLNREKLPRVIALKFSESADASTSQSGQIQTRVTGNLLKRIMQNNMVRFFDYPQYALRRGWQGQVTIGIRIEADGIISKTILVASSGYGALDHAALKSARQIKQLPSAVALLNGQVFDLKFPVIYRLKDG